MIIVSNDGGVVPRPEEWNLGEPQVVRSWGDLREGLFHLQEGHDRVDPERHGLPLLGGRGTYVGGIAAPWQRASQQRLRGPGTLIFDPDDRAQAIHVPMLDDAEARRSQSCCSRRPKRR